jgi:hypothetical protein
LCRQAVDATLIERFDVYGHRPEGGAIVRRAYQRLSSELVYEHSGTILD